jgi:hypothetical protein
LTADKTIYPTASEIKKINKAVLGELPKDEYDKLPESIRKSIESMNKDLKPRDPARILRILEKLRILWEKYPDQRLGQLLENYVFLNGERGDKTSTAFYLQEEDVTLDNIMKKIKDASKEKIKE